ncbi:MAG: hypothetical protein NVV83_18505 [Afipia sp.]|jgi:hypothetical protein|nr:hypothetical protein [Afipia sp.]
MAPPDFKRIDGRIASPVEYPLASNQHVKVGQVLTIVDRRAELEPRPSPPWTA